MYDENHRIPATALTEGRVRDGRRPTRTNQKPDRTEGHPVQEAGPNSRCQGCEWTGRFAWEDGFGLPFASLAERPLLPSTVVSWEARPELRPQLLRIDNQLEELARDPAESAALA